MNDFEGETYAPWQVAGNAFDPGPGLQAPNQRGISGIRGVKAAISFRQGLSGVGTLTSPQFKIERRYINFLIGGGKLPDSVGLQLSVDGRSVYKSTGNNQDTLNWQAWDLKDYHGKSAQVVIFDFAAGRMGYVIVDQIMQSDVSALKVKPE